MTETTLLTSTKISDSVRSGETHARLQLQCPVCGQSVYLFDFLGMAGWICPKCGFVLSCRDGILRFLTQEREQHFRQFIREYELVRAKEGRGSSSEGYYLQLPFKDLTGHNHWQWQIRARTWRHLERYLLPNIERSYPQGCDVL